MDSGRAGAKPRLYYCRRLANGRKERRNERAPAGSIKKLSPSSSSSLFLRFLPPPPPSPSLRYIRGGMYFMNIPRRVQMHFRDGVLAELIALPPWPSLATCIFSRFRTRGVVTLALLSRQSGRFNGVLGKFRSGRQNCRIEMEFDRNKMKF